MKINEVITEAGILRGLAGAATGLTKILNTQAGYAMQSALARGDIAQAQRVGGKSAEQMPTTDPIQPIQSQSTTQPAALSTVIRSISIPANKILKVTKITTRGLDVYIKYPNNKWFYQANSTSPLQQVQPADAENLDYALKSDFKTVKIEPTPAAAQSNQRTKQRGKSNRRGY